MAADAAEERLGLNTSNTNDTYTVHHHFSHLSRNISFLTHYWHERVFGPSVSPVFRG